MTLPMASFGTVRFLTTRWKCWGLSFPSNSYSQCLAPGKAYSQRRELPLRETLSTFSARTKREIFEDLLAGRTPRVGKYDAELLQQSKIKQPVQMGTTVFHPDRIAFEFIYPDPQASALVLSVVVAPSERIVFLPVPNWVVENIWQGSVDGSFHFETDALALFGELKNLLEPRANAGLFGSQMAKRRE